MRTIISLAAGVAFATASAAAGDIYMDAGIEGDVRAIGYEGQIALTSLDLSLVSVAQGAGRRRGGLTCEPLGLTKQIDPASADLIALAALGQFVPEVTITVVRPGEARRQPVFALTLRQVRIEAFSLQATEDEPVREALGLRYASASGTVFTVRDDGSAGKQDTFAITCP